ncbi:hypothetical protein FHETE_4778 [Fusarium heterosporum]|uniref:Uncharacterized protein n=1 Tax=Fusarium heterosporum TaxID=42747 RepID=A0A8H5TIR3_FUSHE|nr:hypothetical protein FHETE_4778 [Fusarium heterosporum]
MKQLLATCRIIRAMTKPAFYEFVTVHDFDGYRNTKRLAFFLRRSPNIRPLVRNITLLGIDQEFLRLLLSLDLPNLQSLAAEDGDMISRDIGDGRKIVLNRCITVKLNLKTFEFRMLEKLSPKDVRLFQQPSLVTLLLEVDGIKSLAHQSVDALPFRNLQRLTILASRYPHKSLEKILRHATSLRQFEFQYSDHEPIGPDFSTLLQPCKDTLEAVRILCNPESPITFQQPSLSFGNFPAITHLAAPLGALFGSDMGNQTIDRLQEIKKRIPPTVKTLLFQELEVWAIEEEEEEEDGDEEGEWDEDFTFEDGSKFEFSPSDHALIKTILENTSLFPNLRQIAWNAEVWITEQQDICKLADAAGVTLKNVRLISDIKLEDV